MLPIAIITILSYLVGSIPTSIIVARSRGGIDIRQWGSGNAGGTNVIRVLGWKAGVFVIALDMAKGLVATMGVARLMDGPIPFANRTPFDDYTLVQIIAGSAAVLGHVWTLFAGFRGGKGIATAAGMLVGIAPVETAVSFTVFAVVFLITHYVSAGSLSAAVTFPLSMFLREHVFMAEIPGYGTLIFFSLAISLLIVFTHRSNIRRLWKGTENKIHRIPFFSRR
ncbi:MAG: glycerol-3-phosphate 1-O-acyltransferase PlsY [Bacteroidota bacterium]